MNIKEIKFDLSNNYILMGFFLAPSLITDLYLMHQAGVIEKINGLRRIIEGEKYEKISSVKELKLQNELSSILGGRANTIDFIESLEKLNLNLKIENRIQAMNSNPAEILSLARYYLLGFIPKLMSIQQAIEIQLKDKGYI